MSDRYIQTQNGSKTPGLSEVDAFVGDRFSAIFLEVTDDSSLGYSCKRSNGSQQELNLLTH
jgi:hypothetical protein